MAQQWLYIDMEPAASSFYFYIDLGKARITKVNGPGPLLQAREILVRLLRSVLNESYWRRPPWS